MTEVTEDFGIETEDQGQAAETPPEETVPEEESPATEDEQVQENTGNEQESVGESEPDPVASRVEKLEMSFRELQGYSTRLVEMNEELRKKNAELESLLRGDDAVTDEPDGDSADERPLTKKELAELMLDPDFNRTIEEKRNMQAQKKWEADMLTEIKVLQKHGLGTPGTELANKMQEYLLEHESELIGDYKAVQKALAYAKKAVSKSSPADARHGSPPPSTGGGKPTKKPPKSEIGKEITGEGLDAFDF